MTNRKGKSTFAKLTIYEEFEDEQTIYEDFELSISRILIGSSEDNNLILDAPDVDHTHISLELRNHHWILQDMGTPSGTIVNSEAVKEPYCLKEDDLIEVGHIKMKFQGGNSPAPAIKKPSQNKGKVISGRLWFATMAGTTLAVIFIIMFLLIVAHYAGVIDIADLLPF